MIMELLDAFGIATAGAEGFEADDVLARWPRRNATTRSSWSAETATCCRWSPTIPSRSGCSIWAAGWPKPPCSARRSRRTVRRAGDRAGAAYAELALLRGDPSDGLPGVPGVGEKTAATLLAQHGSLDHILAAAHDPKSKMAKGLRAKLLAATDYIEAAGQVVRVATDAPVTLSTPTDDLPLAAADAQTTAELATELGVGSSIARLQKALDTLPA